MIFIILFFNLMFAGQVKITPENVNVNRIITIEYTPDSLFFESQNNSLPYLTIYFYDNLHKFPNAIDYQANLENGKYIYNIKIDSVYNYAIFKFTDGLNEDNNKSKFWDFIIHKYDKAQFGSYLNNAVTYLGNMPDNINRTADLKLAENLIEKELNLFPENFVAKIALTQIKFDQGLLSDELYRSELKRLVNTKIDKNDEASVRALARALKTLGQTEKSDNVEIDFAKEHHNSELYEELMMTKLSEAKDLKSFVEICDFYIQNFEESPKKEQMMLALVSAYMQGAKYSLLQKSLSKASFVYPSVYSKIALELSNLTKTDNGLQGIDLKNEVINNYKKSIELIDSLTNTQSEIGKPRYFSKTEQYIFNYFLSGTFRQNLGEYYLSIMELDSAKKYLTKAEDILKDNADISLFSNLIKFYKLNADTKNAIKTAEKAILYSQYNDTIVNIAKSVLDSIKIDSLFQTSKIERIQKLKYEELDYKVFSGLFKTTNEKYKDIESDTNQYKIVTFFATWCVPCQEMVPALEEIEASLGEDAKLYAINAWEDPKNRDQLIAGFLDEYHPKYTILLDETSIIPQKYGVTGLPITFVLDKESNIKFKIEGFTNKADFVRKCLDRIEYLK